jgi:AbrB family looped-hinge helix DNA binding protein
MKITLREKRQVTLPSQLTEAIGVEPGDILEAQIRDGEIVLRPSRKAALDALKELQRAIRESGVTLEELIEGGKQVRKELFREYYPELAREYDV